MGFYLLYLHQDSEQHSPSAMRSLGFILALQLTNIFTRFGFDTYNLKEVV